MSLTNPNTVVTEQRLNEFYQGILPYLGGMPEMLANKFSKGDLYSTDEKMIGQWIDGKPLYQRVYTDLDITIANTEFTNTNISATTVDQIVDCIGFDTNGSVIDDLICNTYGTGARYTTFNITTSRNTGTVKVNKLAIKYTKTTDSAISIGSDTDYSTEEKIVGTWIDGKPLYQKTVVGQFGTITDGTVSDVVVSDAIPSDSESMFVVNATSLNTSNKNATPLPYLKNDLTRFVKAYINNGELRIATNWNSYSNTNIYVTIQYTKTTD